MVGRAQGLLVASAHDGANVNVALSIMFTNLLYKALAVSFRFARGYAVLQTAFYDPNTSRSVIRLTIRTIFGLYMEESPSPKMQLRQPLEVSSPISH
ncbi:hypothetical protein JHK84_033622 [Glycine max]|nr:hypothetical protein JHK84_033622 [Glycine max]